MKKFSGYAIPFFGVVLIGASAFVYLNCATTPNPNYISAQDLGKIGQVDVTELTPTELKRFDEVINREVSPCGNEYSLAQTILNQKLCPLTPHATSYVLSLIVEDYNLDEISEKYVQRYASVKGQDIEIGTSPVKGAENAEVTVVVFTDFQCPFCAKAARKIERITAVYPKYVKLVFKNFPLESIHPDAILGARAGFAAQQQGKFWDMHDTLFSRGPAGYDPNKIMVMAKGLGLDTEKFEEDLVSEAAKAAIEADVALGEKLGVNGTPRLFVNGRVLEAGVDALDERIKEEFLRKKFLKK
ncbi:MAG: thioredoxin domain-containing protein [Deltaproteobacteria bacterium]|nr:thioredoxin domain-containing protein [Deltaproteobacteria bacterium]